MSANLYIAYCEKNKSVATQISQTLGKANFKFIPLSSKNTKNEEGLTFLIAEAKTPGILLLSDNLLKDEDCMLNMLNFLQNSSTAESMQILVIDGQYSTGNVETTFDRVSSVIRYMNFWQEKYLEMRKQKRTIDIANETEFNVKLQNVKEISSEIGDFLRLVRNKDFWTYEQMIFNNYEVFFKKYGNNTQHQNFINIAGSSVKKTSSPTPVPTPTTPTSNSSINKPTLSPPPPTPAAPPVEQPMKLAAESIEEISAKIPSNSENIPTLKTPTEAPTINDIFQQKAETKNTVNNLSDPPPVKVASDIPVMTIAEKAMMQEEAQVNEVLKEVDYLETQNVKSKIEKNDFPDLGNRIEISADNLETPPTPPSLNEVFMEKEPPAPSSIETDNQLNLPTNVSPDDELEVPEINTFSEVPNEPIEIPTEEIISTDAIIPNITAEEEINIPVMTPEEDFDVMEGIEVEDITNDLEEEIEEEDFQSIYGEEELETPDLSIKEEVVEDIESQNMSINAALVAAGALMTTGAHVKGRKAFETILENHPENVEARYQYAYSLKEEANDLEKATSQFEQIIKLDPVHFPSFKALAEISEQNNDFLLAKSYYEKVVNLNPDEKEVYYKLGLITAGFYAEKPKSAAKYFKKAIQQDPNNADAYYRLGMIQTSLLDKNKKALANFHKTLEINPNHSFANYDLALLYHKLEDSKNAALYYEKAWKLNTELKTNENDLAFDYKDQKEAEEIIIAPTYNNDKTILITGATSGIGRATAMKFAEHGFRIIMTGRRTDRLEELKTQFAESHKDTKVKTLTFDVRNIEEVKSMISNLEEEWKNIDVLINNAGLAKGFSPIFEGEIEHWETMIDTNIKGLLYLTRAVAPHMVERKSGHIINVCSTAGKEVYPNGNVYCATKHAVDALTKAMRLDLYKHNIRVGQVSPAHVEETEFAFVRFEDAEKAKIYNDFQPLKSSDVADALFYIVNTPDYVNVQDIVLMGKQQANSNHIDRSGRVENEENEK